MVRKTQQNCKKSKIYLFGLYIDLYDLFWPCVGFSEFYDAKQGKMCANCQNHAKYTLLEFLNKISLKRLKRSTHPLLKIDILFLSKVIST